MTVYRVVLLASTAAFLAGCGVSVRERRLRDARNPPRPNTPAAQGLKVHLRSGALVVLDRWVERGSSLAGTGTLYDVARVAVRQDTFTIERDSIALLETATRRTVRPAGITIMAVLSTVWGAVTVACAADPKSCFGSCPTFYIEGDDSPRPHAEGFSASIARVLESRDVDALYRARPTERRFVIRMTNEALETHAVRSIRVQAVPRRAGERVLAAGDDRHFVAAGFTAPTVCRSAAGDCRAAVAELDGAEYHSQADSTDLATREMIALEFPPHRGPLGVVVAARHSLMSTFLFYQTMAYLGDEAGAWLATLERGTPEQAQQAMGMARRLGGIDVEVQTADGWRPVGHYGEAGPIATDMKVLPIGEAAVGRPLHVRLRAAKGAWRLDYVALAQLRAPGAPIVLAPETVKQRGAADPAALAKLLDPQQHLVTYPGDVYDLVFHLPERPEDYELFLETEGYYYEWMRGEWLREGDPKLAALALLHPAQALRHFAPLFKRVEPDVERLFWESRYGR